MTVRYRTLGICAIRNLAQTLAVPALLTLLTIGPVACGPVASLGPIYTEKDLVWDPAALGVWYNSEDNSHVHVTETREKAYKVVVIGLPYKSITGTAKRELAMFEAHLVKLKDHLFLDLFPKPYDDRYSRLSAWYAGSLGPAHQIALVKQLAPAPVVAFMDPEYLEKHPPAIRHVGEGDEILLTASTKKVQRFLRRAVKRGAFDKGEWKWAASKATALHFAAAQGRFAEIDQLIEEGVDINGRDEQGRTPLDWAEDFRARANENEQMIELLKNRGAR